MISIVIPAYNADQFISRAIESILVQLGDWELVIVDDHSIDKTPDIVAEYVELYPQIRLIKALSKGVTDARITGAMEARGEYLFFMDADDELPADVVSLMSGIIMQDPDVDLVIGDIKEVKDGIGTYHKYGTYGETTGLILFNDIINCRMGYLWGKAIRKKIFLSLPIKPSSLKFCEDYVQMLQLSLFAKKVMHVGAVSYIYHQNQDSTCNRIKSRNEYAMQFYDLAVTLRDLYSRSDFYEIKHDKHITPVDRMRVMFLYYARLYLMVMGTWSDDEYNLKSSYLELLKMDSLKVDPLYDKKKFLQTWIAYKLPWLMAALYVPLLKCKYHRIR